MAFTPRNTTHGFVDDGQNYCLFRDGTFIKVKDSSFYERAVPVVILLAFQLIFLIHTMYHSKSLKKISKFQTIPFISLQLVGFILTLLYSFTFYAIPVFMTQAVFNRIVCGFMAYSVKIFPFIFHGLTLSILTVRLERIFKGTPSEWSKKTRSICLGLINGIFFILATLWCAYLAPPCIRPWCPYDYGTDSDFMYYCVSYYNRNPVSEIAGYVGIGFTVITNLIIGFYVTLKLKKIYDEFRMTQVKMLKLKAVNSGSYPSDSGQKQKNGVSQQCHSPNNDRIYAMMKKNTILTISICSTTLISYTLTFADVLGGGEMFICLDYFLNPLFVALMFKYNERIYQWIFCCCYIDRCRIRGKKQQTDIEMMVMEQQNHESQQKRDTTTESV